MRKVFFFFSEANFLHLIGWDCLAQACCEQNFALAYLYSTNIVSFSLSFDLVYMGVFGIFHTSSYFIVLEKYFSFPFFFFGFILKFYYGMLYMNPLFGDGKALTQKTISRKLKLSLYVECNSLLC